MRIYFFFLIIFIILIINGCGTPYANYSGEKDLYAHSEVNRPNIDIEVADFDYSKIPFHMNSEPGSPASLYLSFDSYKIKNKTENGFYEALGKSYLNSFAGFIKIKIKTESIHSVAYMAFWLPERYVAAEVNNTFSIYDNAGSVIVEWQDKSRVKDSEASSWMVTDYAFQTIDAAIMKSIDNFQKKITEDQTLKKMIEVALHKSENRFVQQASRKEVPESQKNQSPLHESPKININFRSGKRDTRPSAIAVIIGNRNYSKGIPSVDYAHNDADLIKRYVTETLGYREGNIIDLRDSTQADLISVFGSKDNYKGQLFGWLRPNDSDVFVYYSGHGAPGLSTGQGYLLPVDASPNTVELNGYPLEVLYTNLGKLPAKSLTVVVDACFSGSSQAGSVVKNASAISLRRVNVKTTLPHATILTATGISEVASWDEEAKLGLFTRYFLDGATGKADHGNFGNGDGQVTLREMKKYLESEVTYMARRMYMREQHPQISGNHEGILSTVREL